MSARDEDRRWLLDGQARRPDGWEAEMIAANGMEGALDLLACQGGRPGEVNLTHRPFAGNDHLKELVRGAREAIHDLSQASYQYWWAERQRIRIGAVPEEETGR